MAYAADYTKDAGNYNVGWRKADDVITLNRMFSTATHNLASGSYYKLFAVPANFQVLEAYVTCHTAETSSASDSIDIVDDDSATTTFVNDAAMAAGKITGTNARKMFTAAGYIVVLANNDLATAVFEVCIRGKILNTNA
jgi:hypothetical protein